MRIIPLTHFLAQAADRLYLEGIGYYSGLNFRTSDVAKGKRMMVEAMEKGSFIAKAYCHYHGWGGLHEDEKEAFRLFSFIATHGHGAGGEEEGEEEEGGEDGFHNIFEL